MVMLLMFTIPVWIEALCMSEKTAALTVHSIAWCAEPVTLSSPCLDCITRNLGMNLRWQYHRTSSFVADIVATVQNEMWTHREYHHTRSWM